MNSLRKWLCLSTAVVLATFALPSIGDTPNKHFNLSVVPGTVTIFQQDTTVIASLFNDNPSGSSAVIGSFTLSVNNVSGIQITSGDRDPVYGGTVSPASSDGKSISVTGITLKAGETYQLTVHVKGCGDGNQWSALVWAGQLLNGGTYDDDASPAGKTTHISCGVLACGSALDGTAVSNIISEGFRGTLNQDGTCSFNTGGVNYFVTDLVDTKGYLHVRLDSSQPAAALYYVVKLDQPLVDSDPPYFAWNTVTPDGNPIFVKGQHCDQGANAQLPAPIATVISDNGGKQIKVNVTAPLPPVPFAIVIGVKPTNEEYMTVTKVSTQTFTVVRGLTAYIHSPGDKVMSSPMPALPSPLAACFDGAGIPATCPYAPGAPAQMCYVYPPPGGDLNHLYLFDIGDGWSSP